MNRNWLLKHLIYIYQYIQSDDSYRRLLKNVQLEKSLPIFHRNRKFHKFDFAFIQLAIERNRCLYIDPSFNEQILNLVSLQRAKFYQESYHNYSTLFFFHNDIFMCICDRFRLTQFYIIVSSILGTCYLILLTLKFISTVLLPYLSNRLSCIFMEYFLKCLPTMVDWLNKSVLLERV